MSEQVNISPNNSTIVRSKAEKMRSTFGVISKINPAVAVDLALVAFSMPIKRRKKGHLFPEGTIQQTKVVAGKKITHYKFGESIRKVLMVHGWEGSASDFAKFILPLDKAGFEVHCFDLPGHGYSPFSSLTAKDAADIVRELEESFGPFSAIVGHSFGAFSSAYALSQYPELAAMPFVSIAAPTRLSNVVQAFSQAIGLSDSQVNNFRNKIERKFSININDFMMENFLSDHQGPVLVIHDKDDAIVPVKAFEALKKQIPNCQYLLSQGLGHNRILRNRDIIDQVVGFVGSQRDQRARYDSFIRFGIA